MLLYHGSPTGGIRALRPSPSNHDKPYVYLTDCPSLALLYAYNPIERPGGFFPYWFDKAGQLHYDEYFPDQTRRLYAEQAGWVYRVEAAALIRLDKMPWVWLSEAETPVAGAEFIADLYAALLLAESNGQLMIHRFEDIPPAQQEIHRRIVRQSMEGHHEDDYIRFLQQYIPELF
ncbi:MAG: hypothetical protein IKK57_06750 [Clostridia bacterium]|nr:hypothetical protein [Clostridia bacterium]